jgi:hypothetical protein
VADQAKKRSASNRREQHEETKDLRQRRQKPVYSRSLTSDGRPKDEASSGPLAPEQDQNLQLANSVKSNAITAWITAVAFIVCGVVLTIVGAPVVNKASAVFNLGSSSETASAEKTRGLRTYSRVNCQVMTVETSFELPGEDSGSPRWVFVQAGSTAELHPADEMKIDPSGRYLALTRVPTGNFYQIYLYKLDRSGTDATQKGIANRSLPTSVLRGIELSTGSDRLTTENITGCSAQIVIPTPLATPIVDPERSKP